MITACSLLTYPTIQEDAKASLHQVPLSLALKGIQTAIINRSIQILITRHNTQMVINSIG